METRKISHNEIRVYKLVLNRMTFAHIEEGQIVAISTDYQKLVDWYRAQMAPEVWRDGRWSKSFAQGSYLEWHNPVFSLELNDTYPFGQGISDEWVPEETLGRIYRDRPFFIVE